MIWERSHVSICHSGHRSPFSIEKKLLDCFSGVHDHKMAAESVPPTRDVTIKVEYCAVLLTSLRPFRT